MINWSLGFKSKIQAQEVPKEFRASRTPELINERGRQSKKVLQMCTKIPRENFPKQ